MNVSMSKLYRNGLPSKIFGFAFHRRICPHGRSSLARILQEAGASITAFPSREIRSLYTNAGNSSFRVLYLLHCHSVLMSIRQ